LLAEYCGEVVTEHNTNLENDSIMELLSTDNPKTTLNVVPDKYANVARFFNGINNSNIGSKIKQQNIRTMRC
jgi:hypothetical protein